MKVLISGKLPKEVIARVNGEHDVAANSNDRPFTREELLGLVGDKDGLLCTIADRIDDALLAAAPGLRMIANYGVGYDNIDLAAATARGIRVSNTPGVLTEATADITLALILAVARRVVEGDAMTRSGDFRPWTPMHFLGTEVSGKTLGIVGLGQIGKAVARRAKAFNMTVVYHNRHRLDLRNEEAMGVIYASLEDLLARADFVSLHVPLTSKSVHLMDSARIAMMKPTAYLINASRGKVVDEASLVEALKLGKIAGAGLDVYENEPRLAPGLTELKNVVLLPHIGSATIETRTAMAVLAAENLLAGLSGRTPPNCLNCADTAAHMKE